MMKNYKNRNYKNEQADQWYESLRIDQSKLPFSFVYEGRKYEGFSSRDFLITNSSVEKDGNKETAIYTYNFKDILTITLLLTHYYAHGATEWTVWFENASKINSGVLECMQVELCFEGQRPIVKGILGDHVNLYRPYEHDLTYNPLYFHSISGRATHIEFPYFNLEYGDCGAMLAIGWAGTWRASFEYDGNITKYVASSVIDLKTYLKPGEKVRTALFVIAPYSVRNEHYATNYWRDWYVKYNLPKVDITGKELQPFSTVCLDSDTGHPHSDGSTSERHTTWRPTLEKMLSENVKIDVRWMDAGWYVRPDGGTIDGTNPIDWWEGVGTWRFDPIKWPKGTFLESTDFARANDMRTLLWFEPERVTDVENLVKNYGYKEEWAIKREGDGIIVNNIGDPDCLAWTTQSICNTLRENKVEIYREDCNYDPCHLWNYLDNLEGENRKGITESKFIIGHYKMWDDIIECTLSFGGCGFVDSCASGGGRNDLESLRRSVPLLRSDADRTTIDRRLSVTTAFNRWVPFNGASTAEKVNELDGKGKRDAFIWRASYLASLNIDAACFTQDPNYDFDTLRFGLQEWKRVAPYLLKEFYPLTSWNREEANWGYTAYAYFDPDTEKGVLLAFRQGYYVPYPLQIKLPFIKGGDSYILRDEDSGEEISASGIVSLNFNAPKSARLLWIEKK